LDQAAQELAWNGGERRKLINECLSISLFAYVGVALRIALVSASSSTGTNLLDVLGHDCFLQNILGSALMGFAKNRKSSSSTVTLLATGVTTGLCGCLTTFATWMLTVNDLLRGKSPACSASSSCTNAVLVTLLSICVFLSSLRFGRQLAHTLRPSLLPADTIDRIATTYGETTMLLCLLVTVTLIVWIMVAVGFAKPTVMGVGGQSKAALAVAFAPLGAVLRFRLSKLNGKAWEHFPIGTFAANMGGSILAVILSIAVSSSDISAVQVVLMAASTGFTGSLSTVSTFVNELDSLGVVDTSEGDGVDQSDRVMAGWRPHVYAAGSVVSVQVALLAVYGLLE
jgi:fluoride ion exporter CrcB/FEX